MIALKVLLLSLFTSTVFCNPVYFKFTLGGVIYFGHAESQAGDKLSQWLEILSVKEIESTSGNVETKEITTGDLTAKYKSFQPEEILQNSGIWTSKSVKLDIAIHNAEWQAICIIKVEPNAGSTSMRISYELHKKCTCNFLLGHVKYFSVIAENISGRGNKPWLKIIRIGSVDDLNLPIDRDGDSSIKALTRLSKKYAFTNFYLTFDGTVEYIYIKAMIERSFQKDTVVVSYEIISFYNFKFVMGDVSYTGIAEEVNTESTLPSLQILEVQEMFRGNKKENVSNMNLCNEYKSSDGNLTHVGIAKTNSPYNWFDTNKSSWTNVKVVKALPTNETLQFSYEICSHCHYLLTLKGMVYYGTAELGITVGEAPNFTILDVETISKKDPITLEGFINMLKESEATHLGNVAMALVTTKDITCNPKLTDWLPINITHLSNTKDTFYYSPLAMEKLRGKALLHDNFENIKSELELEAFVFKKIENNVSVTKAPVEWNGELSLYLRQQSGTPYSIENPDHPTDIILEIVGKSWVLEVTEEMMGSNFLFKAKIKTEKVKRSVLRINHKGVSYFGYINNSSNKMAVTNNRLTREILLASDGILRMCSAGPYVSPRFDKLGIYVTDLENLCSQPENAAIGLETQDIFVEKAIKWTPITITRVHKMAIQVSVAFEFIYPKELSMYIVLANANDTVATRENRNIKEMQIRTWANNSGKSFIRDVLELGESSDLGGEARNVLGENAKIQVFISGNPNDLKSWKRFVAHEMLPGNDNRVTGETVSNEVFFWIKRHKNPTILCKIIIDEFKRSFQLSSSTKWFGVKANGKLTPKTMVDLESCLREPKNRKFGINRSVSGLREFSKESWIPICNVKAQFPQKTNRSRTSSQTKVFQVQVTYGYMV